MRRNEVLPAFALVVLLGGCTQAGAPVGDAPDGSSKYPCQDTSVPADVRTEGVTADQHGDCAPRYDLGDLGDATVALDPDRPADASSSEVHLLVTEVACASGKPADGRVSLERLAELEDRVELVIGVESPPGDEQTCPANPPTPFTVRLGGPLGNRSLVDVAVYPERELAVAGEKS